MRIRLVLTPLLPLIIHTTLAQKPHAVVKPKKETPFKLGVVDDIRSTALSEIRTLNIYLPEGYAADSPANYPVIYLLDGGADEDFIHIVGLVQYNTFSWIDRIPKSIVVGIANTDRRRDFTYPTTIAEDKEKYPTTGGSANFITFVERELQPYIKRTYKAGNDKTLIGQSLGGLLATEILLTKPRLFNRYIIVSPSLWWDDGSLLNKKSPIFMEYFSHKTDIYIGVGKEGAWPGKGNHVMEDDAKLLASKIKNTKSKNVTATFDYLPAEDHATILHPAVFNAFRLLYPKTPQSAK